MTWQINGKPIDVDEAKIARVMEVIERNVELECQPYDVTCPTSPIKPNRKLERELIAELTHEERKVLGHLCRAKAKEYWLVGDNWRKNLWGGW